jgi:hypothetical protein
MKGGEEPLANVFIDNWVTVELLCTQGGQVVETVFCYRSGDMAITEGDAFAFAVLWRDTMKPIIQAATSVGLSLDRVKVKTHFSSFPNVEAIADFPAATTGQIAGDISPGNVTLAVKLLTGIVGRSFRGRQFWPGIAESGTTANIATSGTINLISQVFTRHLLGWASNGHVYLPAVASRHRTLIRVLVSFAIDQFLDSQRRRLSNRGR